MPSTSLHVLLKILVNFWLFYNSGLVLHIALLIQPHLLSFSFCTSAPTLGSFLILCAADKFQEAQQKYSGSTPSSTCCSVSVISSTGWIFQIRHFNYFSLKALKNPAVLNMVNTLHLHFSVFVESSSISRRRHPVWTRVYLCAQRKHAVMVLEWGPVKPADKPCSHLLTVEKLTVVWGLVRPAQTTRCFT